MTGNLAICIFIFALVSRISSFRWENCGASTDPIKLQDLSMTKEGSTIYITMRGKVAVNLTEPIKAEIKIQKRIPVIGIYVTIPCVDNVGSCTYKNVCNNSPYKNTTCPDIFLTNNLPCRCPVEMNSYSAKKFPVDLSWLPASALKGTFKINITLFKYTQELFCVNVKINF